MGKELKEEDKFLPGRNTCLDCSWANRKYYETGTVDDVEYRCTLQNNKLIYDDLHDSPDYDYNDLPECPIGMFEQVSTH